MLTLNDFIDFARNKYGVTINVAPSDSQDNFGKIFNYTFRTGDCMTDKQAHEVLEDFQRLLTNYRHISSELTEANGIAIQAVEKQIPKAAIEHIIPYDVPKNLGRSIYSCPTCKREFVFRENYCNGCGQKIDWESKWIQ